MLAGANTYTGVTTVNQGTLTASANAFGSSAGQLTSVTVASGATFNNALVTIMRIPSLRWLETSY